VLDRLQPAERTAELDSLYRELYPTLLRFAEGLVGDRADAEEAVHEAFAAATGAGPLREPRPWLFRVTRNAAVTQLRRRRRTVHLESVAEPEAVAPTLEEGAELAEDMRVLRKGVDHLPEKQRTALMLRELGGLSYGEIESVLDVSEAAVKVLIFRARKNLQDFVFAARQPCDEAQMLLSARYDGELSRSETARARMHALSCRRCGTFSRRLRDHRVSIGALVPLIPWDHVHLGTLYAIEGGAKALAGKAAAGKAAAKGAGGIIGLKAAAAATTAAVVTLGAGGVAVWHPKLPDLPLHRPPIFSSAPARPKHAPVRQASALPGSSSGTASAAVDSGGSGDLFSAAVATQPRGGASTGVRDPLAPDAIGPSLPGVVAPLDGGSTPPPTDGGTPPPTDPGAPPPTDGGTPPPTDPGAPPPTDGGTPPPTDPGAPPPDDSPPPPPGDDQGGDPSDGSGDQGSGEDQGDQGGGSGDQGSGEDQGDQGGGSGDQGSGEDQGDGGSQGDGSGAPGDSPEDDPAPPPDTGGDGTGDTPDPSGGTADSGSATTDPGGTLTDAGATATDAGASAVTTAP
jgi:RNA polymerase sigma factor (sigma-70 family)